MMTMTTEPIYGSIFCRDQYSNKVYFEVDKKTFFAVLRMVAPDEDWNEDEDVYDEEDEDFGEEDEEYVVDERAD
jgi:hypothetical protein